MKNLSTTIPFSGFYESILSHEMDSVLEREIEYRIEKEREEGLQAHERLDDADYQLIFDQNINYQIWREHLAEEWLKSFENYFSDIVGEKISFTFEKMTSPRYYNFETDRLFASISMKDAAKLYAAAKRNLFVDLDECIKESFTRRDGFIPHYSNNLETWLAKPLREWDHNEIGTLIMSFLKGEHDLDFNMLESMVEHGDFDEGLWKAIDSECFEQSLAESRIEKLEAILDENPDFVPPPQRCPKTLDMGF
jgi:hypothetical protein